MNVAFTETESQEDYDMSYFPYRGENPPDFDTLIEAISLYPKFCGEFIRDKDLNRDSLGQTCERELATLFAHISFTSGEVEADFKRGF